MRTRTPQEQLKRFLLLIPTILFLLLVYFFSCWIVEQDRSPAGPTIIRPAPPTVVEPAGPTTMRPAPPRRTP